MPASFPTYEHWRATMVDMVLFHQEQALPWLWLPTPSLWIEQLHSEDDAEQAALRAKLIAPSTPQPDGLSWYAWDTRDKKWLADEPMLVQWYSHWVHAQSVG